MLRAANAVLATWSPVRIAAIAFSLVGVVGAIDYSSGYELAFSIFYAIPVSIASWYGGRRLGLAVSVVSAITWLTADLAAGHPYSHPTIPFWNASVRLGFFIIIACLLDRLRESLALQELLARQDGLTGILNARAFGQRCGWVCDMSSRHGRPFALGYIDLDHFKSVNDSLGHSAGDRVLREVAGALTRRLRASDFGARLGGDEFAVLLPETDLAGARVFFAGLRESLADLAARNGWPVGYSIGVAVFPQSVASVDEAIRCADGLMYRVKNAGRNDILLEEFPAAARSVPAPGA